MFDQLEAIFHRLRLFEFYTADGLWTDEHTSAQMLADHLAVEERYADVAGSTYNPEQTEFAAAARKR